MSERDRSGWKFGSPPVLVHPIASASMLEGDSSIASSGSGGAPGSPGFGRLEEVVEEATPMLTAATSEGKALPLWNDGRLSEPATSELDGLLSPSGWNSRVELFENEVGKLVVVLPVLTLLTDEELEAPAVERQVKDVFKHQEHTYHLFKLDRFYCNPSLFTSKGLYLLTFGPLDLICDFGDDEVLRAHLPYGVGQDVQAPGVLGQYVQQHGCPLGLRGPAADLLGVVACQNPAGAQVVQVAFSPDLVAEVVTQSDEHLGNHREQGQLLGRKTCGGRGSGL